MSKPRDEQLPVIESRNDAINNVNPDAKDAKPKLHVHRNFLWQAQELPAGAEFPQERATPEQLAELEKEGFISRTPFTGLEGIEALEPGTGRSPTPAAAKALDPTIVAEQPPMKAEARHVKHTGPVAPDQSESTLTAEKVKAKAAHSHGKK